MTRAELRSAITLRAQAWGVSAYPTNTEIDKLINLRLAAWSHRTRCMFSDRITLVHGGAAGPFDFNDSSKWTLGSAPAVNLQLIEVADLYAGGRAVPRGEKSRLMGAYMAQSPVDGLSGSWILNSERSLELWGAASSASVQVQVAAYYYHPQLAADNAVTQFAPAMDEPFIDFVLEGLLEPSALEGPTKSKFDELRARNDQVIAAWRSACEVQPVMASRVVSSRHIYTPGNR